MLYRLLETAAKIVYKSNDRQIIVTILLIFKCVLFVPPIENKML